VQRARDRSRSGGGGPVSQAAIVAAIVLAANGALYDPSDLTSLYQSRTGGSTGATGQPVGIMLDKSYMGGKTAAAYIAGQAELVTNGDFATDTAWTKGLGWAISAGLASATLATSDLSQASILTVGSWYAVTYTVSGYVTGTLTPKAGSGTSGTAVSANGTYTAVLRAATTTSLIFTGAAFTGSIDNVSAKAIQGFHALAPSDAARPIVTVASGLTYLTTDGADDWYNVLPVLNLGEAWWHVGGWRSDTDGRRSFATATASNGAVRRNAGKWQWINSAAANATICDGDPSIINVMTIQQASTVLMSGRYNGGAPTTIIPADDSGATQGLALFTAINTAWSSGMAGRFYGGAWAPGTITDADRSIMELFAATLSGVTLS